MAVLVVLHFVQDNLDYGNEAAWVAFDQHSRTDWMDEAYLLSTVQDCKHHWGMPASAERTQTKCNLQERVDWFTCHST